MTEQEIANKIQRILDSLGRDSVKTLVITLDDSTERVSCGSTISEEELFNILMYHVDNLTSLGRAAIGAVALSDNYKHTEILRREYGKVEAQKQAAEILVKNQRAFNSKMKS